MTENPNTVVRDAIESLRPLPHEAVAAILRRHKGSLAQIADALGVRSVGVTNWLKGKITSARIAAAAQAKAQQLLDEEKAALDNPRPTGTTVSHPGRTTHF